MNSLESDHRSHQAISDQKWFLVRRRGENESEERHPQQTYIPSGLIYREKVSASQQMGWALNVS
jgi:hypothetical protein